MFMRRLATVITVTVLTFSACGDEAPPDRADASPSTQGAETPDEGPHQFDRLSLTLELERDEVASGGSIDSFITVRNDSKQPVSDPGCLLYAFNYGLIPAGQPDADLWGQVVIDCSGPFVFRPGYVDRFAGPSFRAADMYGDPLPPGDYIAAVAIERRSERLTQPVTITP